MLRFVVSLFGTVPFAVLPFAVLPFAVLLLEPLRGVLPRDGAVRFRFRGNVSPKSSVAPTAWPGRSEPPSRAYQ